MKAWCLLNIHAYVPSRLTAIQIANPHLTVVRYIVLLSITQESVWGGGEMVVINLVYWLIIKSCLLIDYWIIFLLVHIFVSFQKRQQKEIEKDCRIRTLERVDHFIAVHEDRYNTKKLTRTEEEALVNEINSLKRNRAKVEWVSYLIPIF